VPSINDFNKYSKENNVGIKLILNLINPSNSSTSINDYGTTVETTLSKGQDKYDIIFFDNVYTKRYGKYLLDLNGKLPESHINMYKFNCFEDLCVCNSRLVSLPFFLDRRVFYVNMNLLNKYGKEIPRTWDELIETGRYIYDEELKRDNKTDLVIYNGSLEKSESGAHTFYEFLYSFRKSPNDPMPKIDSPEAVEALKKFKELKEKISSDEEFKLNNSYIKNRRYNNKAIFLKFWFQPAALPYYKFTTLPGRVKGISSSSVGGSNIGINISSKKQEAAIKVLEYFTTKDYQRKYSLRRQVFSGIMSLYQEDEVCEKMDCELVNSLQSFVRPTLENESFDKYSVHFIDYIYEYMFGNKSAEEVLKSILDLRKIYTISLNTKNSSAVGLIIFIIMCFTIGIILSSLLFLYISSFKSYFQFLPKDFWILSILGIIMVFCMSFTEYGEITVFKCHIRLCLLSLGFSLNMITILYKLVINFPDENKISNWVENHRYYFLSIFIGIDLIFNGLLLIRPYNINYIYELGGQKFQYCDLNQSLSKNVEYIFITYKILIILAFIILVFLEWNMRNIVFDIRILVSSIYIDGLCLILLLIFNSFKIKNYVEYFLIKVLIYSIYGFSNYMFLYGFRIIYSIYKKFKHEEDTVKFNVKMGINSGKATKNSITDSNSNTNTSINKSGPSQLYHSILDYHNRKEKYTGLSSTSNIQSRLKGSTTDINNSTSIRNNTTDIKNSTIGSKSGSGDLC